MSIKEVLSKQIRLLRPEKNEISDLKKLTKIFTEELDSEIVSKKINADVFVGGSFAKGTFMKSDKYDIDIFVRFDWKYVQLSEELEKIITPVCKKLNLGIEKVHGSRDYFRVYHPNNRGYFEVIPVTRIKKPTEERNVTDLSYFHVSYIKNKISGLEDQVRLAKQFFKAQRVYGAETYVSGFSGYTVELLIAKYKSFIKMIKAISKIDSGNREVLDIAKHYKNKKEVFIQINEAKLHSPIIIVDPTYKERNALAALSKDTLKKLQESIKIFLKRPSEEFFVIKELDEMSLRNKSHKKKEQFLIVEISTDKQHGDIAGTKLKKFAEVLYRELNKYFDVRNTEFSYDGEHSGKVYFSLKPKKEIIRIGPPIDMKKNVSKFKSLHSNTFVKNKRIHARLPVLKDAFAFLHSWKKSNEKMLGQMHIVSMDMN